MYILIILILLIYNKYYYLRLNKKVRIIFSFEVFLEDSHVTYTTEGLDNEIFEVSLQSFIIHANVEERFGRIIIW